VPADTRRVRDAGGGARSNIPPHTRVCRVPQRRTGTVTRVGRTPTYRAPYRRGAPRRVTPSAGRGGAGGQAAACGYSRAQQGGGGAHETPRAAGTRGGGGRRPSVRCCPCWCRPSVPVGGAFIGASTDAGGSSNMTGSVSLHEAVGRCRPQTGRQCETVHTARRPSVESVEILTHTRACMQTGRHARRACGCDRQHVRI